MGPETETKITMLDNCFELYRSSMLCFCYECEYPVPVMSLIYHTIDEHIGEYQASKELGDIFQRSSIILLSIMIVRQVIEGFITPTPP